MIIVCRLWNTKPKGRAPLDFGLGQGSASVPGNDAVDIRQADTRALKSIRCVQALEYTKKLVGMLHVESSAIVADIKFQFVGKIFAPHTNFSVLAFAGIFDRIRQQVDPNLFEHCAIDKSLRQRFDLPSDIPSLGVT